MLFYLLQLGRGNLREAEMHVAIEHAKKMNDFGTYASFCRTVVVEAVLQGA